MLLAYSIVLFLAVLGPVAYLYLSCMHTLGSTNQSVRGVAPALRYRPMLRLLSEDDLALVASNATLRSKVRAQRRELFRSYLRCLTKDYAGLLASVRMVMVQSSVDRPDLVKALAKNKMLFAVALCRIEFRLQLHAFGFATVDVSGLVNAIEALRGQVTLMNAAPMAA